MSQKEAQSFLKQYFNTYPLVQKYIDDTIEKAKSDGFVETLLGRKRFFPELQSGSVHFNQRGAIERAAINAPIQGTNADIMKIAMNNLHRELRERDLQARMLLQVHDELVLELPPEEKEEVVKLVCSTMENAYTLDVPLKVDAELGTNWYESAE